MRIAVKTNQKSENSEENVSNFSGFLVNHKFFLVNGKLKRQHRAQEGDGETIDVGVDDAAEEEAEDDGKSSAVEGEEEEKDDNGNSDVGGSGDADTVATHNRVGHADQCGNVRLKTTMTTTEATQIDQTRSKLMCQQVLPRLLLLTV
ncbi:hypothetical protein TYRP_017612 [Tyrophagus putrescentiae]|nr:hypothetical protein TYRP_017612 [Tyrophagus putrescentiae]